MFCSLSQMDTSFTIITRALRRNLDMIFISLVCLALILSECKTESSLGGPQRFRSAREFIPHATWLLEDMKGDCECKYCSKRTQKEITAEMGAAGIISTSMSPGPQRVKTSRDKGKARDPLNRGQRGNRTYAAVRRVAKPLKPSPGILSQPMLVGRDHDLRAIYSQTSMELRRWFREGEVVWCALPQPILASDDPVVSIYLWPGVVEEVKLKTEAISRSEINVSSNESPPAQSHRNTSPGPSSTECDASRNDDTIGPRLELSDEPLPWTVRQSTTYKIQFLAVSHSYVAADDQVLPYSAHVPSEELINFMLAFDPEKLIFDKEALSQFDPSAPSSVHDAVPAYAASLQIASTVSSYWSLTDEYDVKYSVTTTPPASPKPLRPPLPSRLQSSSRLTSPSVAAAGSIENAINQASEANAQSSISITPHAYHRNIRGIDSSLPQNDVQRTSQRMLGLPPPPGAFVQTRFQGVWWGTERIWVDDFIRLKVPRRTLAPKGTDHILPPSGPGKTTLETWQDVEADIPAELGAGSRGVFLRLDGIFAVDIRTEDDQYKKEARVCGVLYELADEDWEDPNSSEKDSGGPSSGQGGSDSKSKTPAADAGLISDVNGTNKANYPLPQPPLGYKFRPILTPGHEFIGAMGLISGRYYPRILSHPRLRSTVGEALSRPAEKGGVVISDNLWALEGLSGGYFNTMDPIKYKKSRIAMMQDADRDALAMLRDYAQEKQRQLNGNSEVDPMDMDVDEMYA